LFAVGYGFDPVKSASDAVLWALVAGAAGVASAMYTVFRLRKSSLAVTDEGLIVDRIKYRLHVRWADFEGVNPEKWMGLVRTEALVFRPGRFEPALSPGFQRRLIARGCDRVIRISVYDADWRTGPIGQRLLDTPVDVQDQPLRADP